MGKGAARAVRPVRARPFEHQQLPAGTELLSLDVFDTLLWRRVAKPTDAFEILGQRLADDGFLAPGCTPAPFAQLCIRTETLARLREKARSGSLEVSIWQMTRQIRRRSCGWTSWPSPCSTRRETRPSHSDGPPIRAWTH